MNLAIVGASARSASQSAIRAGLIPLAHDLFGDRDLPRHPIQAIAPSQYPRGFEAILANLPDGCPWMFTGALENHPDLIDRMARLRPLWGILGDSLRGCRDPLALASALRSRGLPSANVQISPDMVPQDGSWLVKPLASAGGRRIEPWRAGSPFPSFSAFFQERIEGLSLAAIFVGMGRSADLVGVTRQILSAEGNPFAYVGSIGPWPVSSRTNERIARIGNALAGEFGLRGIFGVDLVVDREGEPFAVEVNPRYTASVEVLELATGRTLLADHAEAFGGRTGPALALRAHPPAVVGKAILFAPRASRLPAMDVWTVRESRSSTLAVSRVADLPAAGQRFGEGEPVMTVLARGSSVASCEARLERRLARWRSRLVDEAKVSP